MGLRLVVMIISCKSLGAGCVQPRLIPDIGGKSEQSSNWFLRGVCWLLLGRMPSAPLRWFLLGSRKANACLRRAETMAADRLMGAGRFGGFRGT